MPEPVTVNAAQSTDAYADLQGVGKVFWSRRGDVEALRGVGLGIAMANGSDAAKVAAARTSRWEYTEDAVARELAQLAADGAFGPGVRLGGGAL